MAATNGMANHAQWSPASWRDTPAKQEVLYEDRSRLETTIKKLNQLPPIVSPYEIENLKSQLKLCAEGNAFLLQGGDCAELFDYCQAESIEAKVKLVLQMSIILIYGGRKKVVRVLRAAGQYAKPRSSPTEVVNGVTMQSFRGDILNSFEPNPKARELDPGRLLDAYFHSAATLNYMRSAVSSGIADMHAPLDWSLGHVSDDETRERYQKVISRIIDTLEMMQTIGVDTGNGLESVDLFTSHEGLLLEYEQALTRKLKLPHNAVTPKPQATSTTTKVVRAKLQGSFSMDAKDKVLHELASTPPKNGGAYIRKQSRSAVVSAPPEVYYNTSSHFLWIGDRTRQLDHAHVEYFRGIANPIGVKVGPTMPPADLVPLLDILNPYCETGKVVLITRYGCGKIADHLPAHIKAVQASRHNNKVVWQCDPMHGNGRSVKTAAGESIKTRNFDDVIQELELALQIHRREGSYLGGMHLEMTGDPVTECTGGAQNLTEEDLSLRYTTYCDPRLNEKQALELAFLVAGFYRNT